MSLLISVVSAYSIFFIILNTIPQNEGQVHVLDTNDTKLIWCTINPAEQTKCLNLAHAVKRDRVMFKRDYFEVVCHEGFDKDECMALLDAEKVHITSADAGEVFIGGRYNSLVPIMQEVYEGGFKHYYSVAVIKRGSLSDVTSIDHLRGKKACFAGVGSLAGWIMPIHTLMKKGSMPIVDCNNHVKSAIEFFGHSCAINSLKDKYNPIGDNSDKLCKLCTGKIPGGKCTNADPYAGFEGAFRCLLEAGEVAFLKHSSVDEMISHGNEFSSISKDEFNLLCTDGSRRPLDDYRSCNWGTVPSHAIITTSAANDVLKRKYQEFLSVAVQLYSKKDSSIRNDTNRYDPNRYDSNTYDPNRRDDNFNDRFNYNGDRTDRFNNNDENRNRGFGNNGDENRNREFGNNGDENNRNRFGFNDDNGNFENEYNTERLDHFSSSPYPEFERNGDSSAERRPILYENFELFESAPLYGYRHNLLFQDNSRKLSSISEELQTYIGYLGKTLDIILEIRDCPVNRMTLCVTSDPELEKCIKMRTALKAQLLKPEMVCYKGHSHTHCMQAISAGNADVAVLDASDVYTGGLRYDLVPFMSEVYDLASNDYYAVAVAKEEDPTTDLTYMRGKYTCHTGIYTAAGWVYPLAYLISNGWIRSYGCNSIRAAAEYFTKSCVPGAISSEYNTDVPYDNMCDLCHGASYRYCRRDATEDYYGYTGALRCLVEGGGNVAFVKHTTVTENADGKRREWWARNILSGDFELLCPDGTRAEVSDYKKCNLGKVKSNAIVTRGGYGYNETQIKAYINLFVYAQQFYGRKDPDEFSFSMFYSIPPYSDLIFQDATKQLRGIPTSDRYYSTYLGRDFMRARRIVDCHASAPKTSHAFTLVIFTLTSLQLLYTFYL